MGATKARLDSLISGEHSGALLNPPFTEFAEAAGLKIIDNSQSALPTCQIGVMAACRGWAKENPEALRGFIKAELQAIEWISNQENSDSATKILLNKIPGMDIKAAEAAMQIMLDPIQGIAESEKINMEGVKTILDLRSKFGEPKKELNNPELYIDLTYYDSARD